MPPIADSSEQRGLDGSPALSIFHHTTNEESAAWAEDKGASLIRVHPSLINICNSINCPRPNFFPAVLGECRTSGGHRQKLLETQPSYMVDPDSPKINNVWLLATQWSFDCGMTCALVLAEIFPDKRDALQAVGRDMGCIVS